jgi:hypothetical protein
MSAAKTMSSMVRRQGICVFNGIARCGQAGPRYDGLAAGLASDRRMGGLPASVAGLPVREHDKRIIMAPMLPVQCWIARAALGWSRDRLAREGGMSAHSVKRFEHGRAVTTSISEAIQRTLEKAGVVFIGADDGGPEARLK